MLWWHNTSLRMQISHSNYWERAQACALSFLESFMHHDIFRKTRCGDKMWVETVNDMTERQRPLLSLEMTHPGQEYWIFDMTDIRSRYQISSILGSGHECERKTRCDDSSRKSFECVEAVGFRGMTKMSKLLRHFSTVSDTRIQPRLTLSFSN